MSAALNWPADLTGWTAEERARLDAVCLGATVVVNMSKRGHPRLWAWAHASGLAVRIDRRSRWGNPFRIGRDGDRAEVIDRYREHICGSPELLASVGELAGRVLGCWCAPAPCHGDVLAALAPGLSELSEQIGGSEAERVLSPSELSERFGAADLDARPRVSRGCAIPRCARPRALGRAVCAKHAALGDSYGGTP